jgi:hypothetical protein
MSIQEGAMTAKEAAERLQTIYGGANAAARALGISRVTFVRVRNGRSAGDSLAQRMAWAVHESERIAG